ncbi:MAG: hypothetical protein ACJ746_14145 [Bryobacteraceae bacterium]
MSSTLGALQRLGFSAWLVPEFFAHDPQNCRKLLYVGRAIARFALRLNPGQIARYGAGLAAIPDQQMANVSIGGFTAKGFQKTAAFFRSNSHRGRQSSLHQQFATMFTFWAGLAANND